MSKTATEVVPLKAIRTETILSKLPIHNLAKTQRINLQVTRRNAQGEVELQWEVSANEKYGLPGQLAYKLDTIIINKRIDEVGRPLPQVIRLGSLKQICKELDLLVSGRTLGQVRQAFLQNALAGITTKMKYKGTDGVERKLEAGFTRYSVVFTGESLPDGTKADAVYLVFNKPYWDVLNNAPVRPLDYNYLKELSPIAQRFYEIVSYCIFAASKRHQSEAKMNYSSFCTYSGQQRYFDYQHFRKQMYKIHQPHLASGYIEKVAYEATTDEEGKYDWVMHYKIGRKAKAEYKLFNGKGIVAEDLIEISSTMCKEKKSATKRKSIIMVAPSGDLEDDTEFIAKDNQIEEMKRSVLELLKYFHQRGRQKANYQPAAGSKELSHAQEIVKAYGLEQGKYIVDFAIREAKKTRFAMRSFGAVQQYVDEAMMQYEADYAARTGAQEAEAARRHQEEQEVSCLLQKLTPDQYQVCYEEAKKEILAALPQVAEHQQAEFFQVLVKREMGRIVVSQDRKPQ